MKILHDEQISALWKEAKGDDFHAVMMRFARAIETEVQSAIPRTGDHIGCDKALDKALDDHDRALGEVARLQGELAAAKQSNPVRGTDLDYLAASDFILRIAAAIEVRAVIDVGCAPQLRHALTLLQERCAQRPNDDGVNDG